MFQRNDQANDSGTSKQAEIAGVTCDELLAVLGAADRSTESKIEIDWIFEDSDGNVATVYGWKGSSRLNQWSIGAHRADVAERFKVWIVDRVKALREEMGQP